MKKGYEFEARVERMEFPNRGILRVDGVKVTVKNALPGQKVRVRITRKKGGRHLGKLLEVVEPSPLQTEAPCPHAGTCGGCLYQSIPYDGELGIKAEQIRQLLSPVMGEDVYDAICEGIIPSPREEGYRNKMELTFGDAEKGGQLTLGMHNRGSFYDITATTGCRIMTEDMRKVLSITLDYFRQQGVSYYHRMRHEGYLRHLLLRQAAGTGQLLVDLVTSSQCLTGDGGSFGEEALLEGWRSAVCGADFAGELTGILHTRNDGVADTIADGGTTVLYGQDYFREQLLDLEFRITPFSFFQTNSLGARVLYDKAREYITQACGGRLGTLYDLYSGTGTIAQILAPAAREVVGVEIVPEAVEAAVKNAEKNGLKNVRFLCGDVLKVLDERGDSRLPAPDTLILDPPRDGIHPKALPRLIAYGVSNILYISCKATSLARDLPAFFAAGYGAKRLAMVDMFPRTGGVEVILLLTKD